jgi:hypothetical protein
MRSKDTTNVGIRRGFHRSGKAGPTAHLLSSVPTSLTCTIQFECVGDMTEKIVMSALKTLTNKDDFSDVNLHGIIEDTLAQIVRKNTRHAWRSN